MFRKPYKPAPFFRMPGAPFNPTTGETAQLGPLPGNGTTLALFQVVGDRPGYPNAAEVQDTHDNYVVCRGYEADNDPYFRYLHDPHTAENTTAINVAKPYSVRGTFPYKLGQVIVAARIKGKLGYNPGKAVTVGQPADLDEEISLLRDDDDVSVAWMDLGVLPTVNTPALCVPNTNIPPVSWILGSGFGSTLPSLTNWNSFTATGRGNIYAVKASGSNWKYTLISNPASLPKILNPLPFSFTSDNVLRVAWHDGQWVVLGVANGEIGYQALLGATAMLTNSAFVNWSGLSEVWDVGGIITNNGTELKIATPLQAFQMRFRVEWNTIVIASFTTKQTDTTTEVSLSKNGTLVGQHFSRDQTRTVIDGQQCTATLSGTRDMYLAKDDTLGLYISCPNASAPPTIYETIIRIRPMLGTSLG